jgi:hypothetical protein
MRLTSPPTRRGAGAGHGDGVVTPRPVVCVIEHLHRDRSVADAVRAGRFRHVGVTLDLGTAPDWHRAGLPDDDEWRIEWSKFYYGLDLAHAYRETGQAGYLDAWLALVGSWMEQVAVGRDSSEVTARRIQNWVYAWLGFAAAPGFPGLPTAFAGRLLASLAEQLARIEGNLTAERNHRTLELYALLVVSLALPALDPGGARAAAAMAELHRNLLTDVWPDGVHRECSTHYHLIALRSFVGARQNAVRFGLPVHPDYDARLAAACRFALHAHRPDGIIPALSDADNGSYLDVLARAAAELDRPDLRYVATAGTGGTAPVDRYVGFPAGGYYIQRSGWGAGATAYADERFLILDAGPLGDGGHGHYDLLNVEIYGAGRPLIVDPGRYTYSEAWPNWRRRFKSTRAHNTVTVDNLDQTPYRRGKPKGPVAAGRLVCRHGLPGFDLLTAEARSPAYDAVHTRTVAFVADEYWLIADDLTAPTPHDYVQSWHLPSAASGRTEVGSSGRGRTVTAPGVELILPAGHEPTVESGWVAPQYGERQPAPVVTVSATGVREASFLTLVMPARPALPPPRLSVLGRESGLLAVRVDGVGPTGSDVDFVMWAPAATRFRLGPLRGDGQVGWLRRAATGRPGRLAVFAGRNLSWSGSAAVPGLSPGPAGWTVLAPVPAAAVREELQ